MADCNYIGKAISGSRRKHCFQIAGCLLIGLLILFLTDLSGPGKIEKEGADVNFPSSKAASYAVILPAATSSVIPAEYVGNPVIPESLSGNWVADEDLSISGMLTGIIPLPARRYDIMIPGRSMNSAEFIPGVETVLTLDGVSLQVPPDGVKSGEVLSITGLLAEDIPPLPLELTNVTGEYYSGYRFLPHGMIFDNEAVISMAFDGRLIPEGYSAEDIYTWFFDEADQKWKPLERDSIDHEAGLIISRTYHFTDMINGIVKVPEAPGTEGYIPTSLTDIKAADPAAGISLISSPAANNTGDADISYPLNIPKGRSGIEPSLSLQYSSASGSGWTGFGWSLSVPAVSVDITWGVPRYLPAKESETYHFGGSQLTPVAHRGEYADRTPEKQFHQRVEGDYYRIIRHGDNPKNYWWEVTTKEGVSSYYGGLPGTGQLADAVSADADGNIGFWALTETRDLHDNFVRYAYEKPEGCGEQLYLSEIVYTGHLAAPGPYRITFLREDELNTFDRKDARINAGYGFIQRDRDLLRRIIITFNDEPVRAWTLQYTTGVFMKTLLESVTELDTAGNEFYKHSFEYYNDTNFGGTVAPFAPEEKWDLPDDNLKNPFLNPVNLFFDDVSSLGGSGSSGVSGGIAATVGLLDGKPFLKTLTAGGNVSYQSSESEGFLSLTDLNGDGLPDKVYKRGSRIYYRPNLLGFPSEEMFGEERFIDGVQNFSIGKTTGFSWGVEAHPVIYLGYSNSRTTTKSTVYFGDFNADGLVDIVDNGVVYFNHIGETGDPVFTSLSDSTPNPLEGNSQIDLSLLPDPATEQAILEEQFPLHDAVRMWQAQYNGIIEIVAPVSLVEDTSTVARDDNLKDGVKVTIQHNGYVIWSAEIDADDYNSKVPTAGLIGVNKGDRIYFRVQSRYNGSYDKVFWDPEILYHSINGSDTLADQKDSNGNEIGRYKASDDFLLCGNQSIGMPKTGSILIRTAFSKPVTSDTLRLDILRTDTLGNQTSIISYNYFPDQVAILDSINRDVEVTKEEFIQFRIHSETNIDWSEIDWDISVEYNRIDDGTPVTAYDGSPLLYFKAIPDYYSMYNNTVFREYPLIADSAFLLSTGLDTIDMLPHPVKIVPALQFDNSAGPVAGDSVFLSVKSKGTLHAKKMYQYDGATFVDADTLTTNVRLGDTLHIEFHFSDFLLAESIVRSEVVFGYDTLNPFRVSALSTIRPENEIFGRLFRGWGQFDYNGNAERAVSPINETLLKLSDVTNTDVASMNDTSALGGVQNPLGEVFNIMIPFASREAYIGTDEYVYLLPQYMSASRLGEKNVIVEPIVFSESGLNAVTKETKSLTNSVAAGGSVGPVGATYSHSWGEGNMVIDMFDMNGDGYPDLLSTDKIQYTGVNGVLSGAPVTHNLGNHFSKSEADGFTLGGSLVVAQSNNSLSKTPSQTGKTKTGDNTKTNNNAKSAQETSKSSIGISGNFSSNEDYTGQTWLDINGDGLPDKIYNDGTVRLNMGYSFAPAEQWNFDAICVGESQDYGGGLGVDIKNGSIVAGVSISMTLNEATETFMDINADGLPDMIKGSNVWFNTGTGFAPPLEWTGLGALDAGESIGESATGGFTVGIAIPIFFIKICINPSASVSRGVSNVVTHLADINGDGMPDFLSSESEIEMTVRPSRIYRTNIMKKVENPLGGSFELDYLLTPAVYSHPGGKLAMKSVKVFDGLTGDGIDTTYTSFEYENGYYDRHERQFYGFAMVRTNFHDTGNDNSIYRTITQQFSNGKYYYKGNLLSETVSDAEGIKRKGIENIYSLRDIHTGALLPVAAEESNREPAFVALEETRQYSYGGNAQPLIATRVTYSYDTMGNITGYTDFSAGNEKDRYSVSIQYHSFSDNYLHSAPSKHEVTTVEGVRRKSETTVNELGEITQIRQFTTSSTATQTDMEYDEFGNLTRLIRPANHRGERLWYEYEYDNIVHSWVTAITDAYGYTSTSVYDYRWGVPTEVTDRNGQVMRYQFDNCGRMTSVTGPYEIASGSPYTIAFEYYPQAVVPHARTMHYERVSGSNIETWSFADGLGRPVQLKKTAMLFTDPAAEDTPGYMVSGRVFFDPFHRTTQTYQPVFEPANAPEILNRNADNIPPTLISYDVLDRISQITLPDGSTTVYRYSFGDYDGETVHIDTLIDALGNISLSYTKATGRKAATARVTGAGTIITGFEYNALGELLSVTDPSGNLILNGYDMVGKRLSVTNPDAGLTEFRYDGAGNLTEKITANLRRQIPDRGVITYRYDHERLTEIVYPRNVQNRVNYTYGEPGAPHNRAGRVVLQQDASGGQEFFYSPLGQIVKTIRTVQLGEADMRTWIWSATFDTWNRVHEMTYPDGERVVYSYNQAGNLSKMDGEKLGRTYAYISRIGYNKFEKQIYQRAGNGTITTYSYEPERQRMSHMTVTSGLNTILSNVYSYDAMSNILSIINNSSGSGEIGGSTVHTYSYDELYQLTSSAGLFRGRSDTSNYQLAVQYDVMGNILQKIQSHNTSGISQSRTTYDFIYKYEGPQPDAATAIGENVLTYDSNGNLVTSVDTVTKDFRQLAWDEENRLTMISDNGYLNRFVYDGSGERILKSHGGTRGIYINGAPAGIANHSSSNYTIYVSPYFVIHNDRFTKHYYNGEKRVVSKIGNGQFQNQYRMGVYEMTAGGVNYIERQQQLSNSIVEYEKKLGTSPGPPTLKGIYADPAFTGVGYPDAGTPSSSAPRGWPRRPAFAPADGPPGSPVKWGAEITNDNVTPGFGFSGTGNFEEVMSYFYHSDHLGSASYVTDREGDVNQFIAYLPFGEILAEQHSAWDSPYKFNAKELDNETRLYYYGARYYDPGVSRWLGVDPLAEDYPGISPFVYCLNNPVKYVDPDGEKIVLAGSGKERQAILKHLQKLTGDNLKVNFFGTVYIAKKGKPETLPVGTQLVSSLIKGSKSVRIKIGQEGSGSALVPDKGYDTPGGAGSQISLDISQKANMRVESEAGVQSMKDTPMEITLGHELVHAERAMTGAARSYEENEVNLEKFSYTRGKFKSRFEEVVLLEELETIGLKGDHRFTENKLRKEHKLDKRVHYNSEVKK
jgi:RHS repeat-associated protein